MLSVSATVHPSPLSSPVSHRTMAALPPFGGIFSSAGAQSPAPAPVGASAAGDDDDLPGECPEGAWAGADQSPDAEDPESNGLLGLPENKQDPTSAGPAAAGDATEAVETETSNSRTVLQVVTTTLIRRTRNAAGEKLLNQYIKIKDLGEGTFGQVKLYRDTTTGGDVALKSCSKLMLKRKKDYVQINNALRVRSALDKVYSEIDLLRSLPPHPNVCRLLEFIDDNETDDEVSACVWRGRVEENGCGAAW